jgi:DNA polymerase-4
MDAFYASVEVLDDPSLKGKAVIVGGAGKRSVVSAASYEARRFGVHSAMPILTARRLCPKGIYLPVRMDRYKEVSDRVFSIFRRYTPLVEPLSIDEAFLDVTGCERLLGDPVDIAKAIREAVRTEVGLTVSAGVASGKMVAKIASDLGKPDGLTVVPEGEERSFLAPLPVGKLWGVGKVTQETLRRMGVTRVYELAALPEATLVSRLGSQGAFLHRLANGVDDRPVEGEGETKSLGREETYEEDLRDPVRIRTEVHDLCHRVASRLRRHDMKGRTVTLKVKFADFTLVTRAVSLPAPCDDGGEIFRAVFPLIGTSGAWDRPVRLLGVSASNLSSAAQEPARAVQLSLFGEAAPPPPPASGRKRGGKGAEGTPSAEGRGGVDAGARRDAAGGSGAAGARPSSPPSGGERPDPLLPPTTVVAPEKAGALNRAVDAIREKYGGAAILPGASAEKRSHGERGEGGGREGGGGA